MKHKNTFKNQLWHGLFLGALLSTAASSYAITRWDLIAPMVGFCVGCTERYIPKERQLLFCAGMGILSIVPDNIKNGPPRPTPQSTKQELLEAKGKNETKGKNLRRSIKNATTYCIGCLVAEYMFNAHKT